MANARRKPRINTVICGVIIVITLFAAAAVAYEPVKVRLLGRTVTSAATAEQERVALSAVASGTSDYTLDMFDEKGAELMLQDPEVFKKVSSIRIRWTCGYSVEHRLLAKDNVVQVVGR